jgi:hypothetical protein
VKKRPDRTEHLLWHRRKRGLSVTESVFSQARRREAGEESCQGKRLNGFSYIAIAGND